MGKDVMNLRQSEFQDGTPLGGLILEYMDDLEDFIELLDEELQSDHMAEWLTRGNPEGPGPLLRRSILFLNSIYDLVHGLRESLVKINEELVGRFYHFEPHKLYPTINMLVANAQGSRYSKTDASDPDRRPDPAT